MFYKIEHELVAIKKDGRLVQATRRSRHDNANCYLLPSCKKDVRKFSFFPRTTREWNSLPPDLVTVQTPELFKAKVSGTS